MSVDQKTWEEAILWLRTQPEYEQLVRDCFFDDPLLPALNRYWESSEWYAVREKVGMAGGRILDIGAGRGISSYAFARDGWQVTALEPDPSLIVGAGAVREIVASTGLPIEIVEAWGESLPFADESFDLVYGRQVLHHAQDLASLCREMARVLKPGGKILATREHVIFRDADLPIFLEKHPLHRLYGGEHAYRLSEYKQAMENAGIQLAQVINPWASPINLYPRTAKDIGAAISNRIRVVPASVFTQPVLSRIGWLLRSPGTSYSFFGVRPS